MGFVDSMRKWFRGETEKPTVEESLSKLGVRVLADKKLEARIYMIQGLLDELQSPIKISDPLEYMNEIKSRLEKLNRGLHSLAFPFYRSASLSNFRELMEGWHLIYALASDWIHVVRNRIKEITTTNINDRTASIDVESLVQRVYAVIQMHIFQDGFLILSGSYLSEDVASSYTTVIQQQGERSIPLVYRTKQDIEENTVEREKVKRGE